MKHPSHFSVLFAALYLIALIRPAYPLVEYYFQMETYLEQCKNKATPELQCQGRCLLMEKLKAAAEAPDKPLPVKIDLQEYPVGLIESQTIVVPSGILVVQTPMQHRLSASIVVQKIFHPPSA